MITQLVNVSIWSEDLNNLLPFYRDVLGLKTAMEFADLRGTGHRPAGRARPRAGHP